jgi:hypothetical protein
MSSLAELAHLDDDNVTNLCKVIRRPGGMIAGPTVPALIAGDPAVPGPLVQNFGTPVSLMAETDCKLLTYYCRFQQRTSNVLDAATMTVTKIRAMETLKTTEKDHKDPDAPEIDEKDWPRTIEAMKEYFGSCLGTTKIPLAYVIRKELVPQNPRAGTHFRDHQTELINRALLVVDPLADRPRFVLVCVQAGQQGILVEVGRHDTR